VAQLTPPGKGSVDLALEGWWAAEAARGRDLELQPAPEEPPEPAQPRPPRRLHGRIVLSRLWALIKMASLAYTTWWAMGYVHARLGAAVTAYGAVCLFAGFGARWRRRFFGPGQLMEPELYEEVGRWLYRAGAAGVLAGGAIFIAQALLPGR
jgi:hypothetical protein